MATGSVLLVDDETKILNALASALRGEGNEVIATASGREAQKLLSQRVFDLLVVDNLMPELSGIEVIRELAAGTPESERPQILMMTAHATVESAIEAMKLGALDYLQKPFEIDEFLVVVRRALHYLAKSRQIDVLDAIVARYLEVAKKKGKGEDAAQWERTQLAFQSALQQMLKVDLPAPEDYKNYVEARRKDPHLFNPQKGFGEGAATSVTLFGAAVTGKNIVFVLDVSGSMMTTDPAPRGPAPDPERGRTVVKGVPGGGQKPKAEPIEERQRMLRAKRELTKVVKSLAPDVRFNLVTYSSDVNSWKKSLVPASDTFATLRTS